MALTLSDYLYATVAYADVFDYPLTGDDLYFRCIKKIPGKNLRARPIPGIARNNYLMFLKGRQSIVETYKKRHEYSKLKWIAARNIAWKLQIIPTIFLVGVTGGLAVNNADLSDDIDLFFITARGTVWITRLLVNIAVGFYGKRRKPGDKHVTDLICLNMFISDDAMRLPEAEQDLFSAHEVLQMEPVWSRRDTYRRFLQANMWVKDFLPVAWKIKQVGRNQHPKVSHWWTRVSRNILRRFEIPAKFLQLWYMSKRRTSEIITDRVLRFHPNDARTWIRKAYEKRLKVRNIPLDKIFYGGVK
jgi:hypothetical protein